MSAGKNPYFRYQIINLSLISNTKRYWTKRELIEKLQSYDFQVSERTLERDIAMMRYDGQLSFFAPIKFCRSRLAYYYLVPDYSINTSQLSDAQVNALQSVVELLRGFKGSQLVKEFEGAIDKIARGAEELRVRRSNPGVPMVMEVECAPYYKGLTWLDLIKQAIDQRHCLRIVYHKFSATHSDTHLFHPYLLKEYKGRWYVLGHSDARGQVITLALDRIEDVQTEAIPYRENTTLHVQEYFKNTIGITPAPGPPEEIILWFTPLTGHYIKTQHLHESQETLQDDEEGLIIRLRLIINYELVSVLLSYCPEVSVLLPDSLAQRLEDLLAKGWEASQQRFAIQEQFMDKISKMYKAKDHDQTS